MKKQPAPLQQVGSKARIADILHREEPTRQKAHAQACVCMRACQTIDFCTACPECCARGIDRPAGLQLSRFPSPVALVLLSVEACNGTYSLKQQKQHNFLFDQTNKMQPGRHNISTTHTSASQPALQASGSSSVPDPEITAMKI